jgi:uncharacterized protein
MTGIRSVRLKTNCQACTAKCCSEPYDWVYLTPSEIRRLEEASSVPAREFVLHHHNPQTGHSITVLRLPCRFFDANNGECRVYEHRPLICRMFPFYPEPLTGHASMLPTQCGRHLTILPPEAPQGWRLDDFANELKAWLHELWAYARAPNTAGE